MLYQILPIPELLIPIIYAKIYNYLYIRRLARLGNLASAMEVFSSIDRDHNSLKRRLRRATQEAEKIRQASKGQTQSNTRS